MKANIKDKDKRVLMALRCTGWDFSSKQVEHILNVVDFVREHEAVTLRDLSKLVEMVDSLYEE